MIYYSFLAVTFAVIGDVVEDLLLLPEKPLTSST